MLKRGILILIAAAFPGVPGMAQTKEQALVFAPGKTEITAKGAI